jgi:hypothetical protein
MSSDTTAQLITDTIDLARAIASGHRTPGDAQQLVNNGNLLSRHFSDTWRPQQSEVRYPESEAITLMHRTGLGALVVPAGALRDALLAQRNMDPELYLRSLRLGALPAWPLPDDRDAEVMLYSLRMPVAQLWLAITEGDAAEVDRQAARLAEGSRWLGARSLGD